MTHKMFVLVKRYTDPAYNEHCKLSTRFRHGLGSPTEADVALLKRIYG